MSIPKARGRVAAVLCGASLAILAAMILFGTGRPQDNLKALLPIVPPALWVAGVLALTRAGRSPGQLSATAAGVLYAVAFLLPAAVANDAGGVVWGFQAFTFGLLVVPIAWLANPVFVVALEYLRRDRPRAALRASALAFLLALTAPLSMSLEIAVNIGFVAWVAGPAILVVALATRREPTEATTGIAPA